MDLSDARERFDRRYAERTIAENTKHYFNIVMDMAAPYLAEFPKADIVEVGCATGAFSYCLKLKNPSINITAIDISKTLVEKGKEDLPDINFLVGDITKKETLPIRTYDAAFMVALHSHFETLEEWLPNFLQLIKSSGRGYLFGLFNPYDVDVIVRVRHRKASDEWLCGWSVISRYEISEFLKNRGVKFKFHDYIPQDVKQADPADPLKSWTQDLVSGERQFVNGIGLIHHFAALELELE